MRDKRFLALLAVLIILLAVFVVFSGEAEADEGEACVPLEAWTETIEHPAVTHEEMAFDYWQRYSWTGGPHTGDSAPTFPGPDWQPNVKGDPHGIGVEGPYFVSHGNSGKGDWFYLESVEKVVIVVDAEAWTETIEHPAVVCDDEDEEEPNDPDPGCDEGAADCYEDEGDDEGHLEPHEYDEDTDQLRDVKPSTTTSCLGGALVTKTTDAKGNLHTSIENAHPSCVQIDEDGYAFQEEGM